VSDDDYWPAEPFLGIGATHTLSERAVRKSRKEPIGFVHFPNQREVKARRRAKPEVKQRRRAKPKAKPKSKRRKR
jgi:hypothetical protein